MERSDPVTRAIRALIYDFDDTIVESERFNDMMFAELLRSEYHIDLSREELDYLYGFSWSGVFAWLSEHRDLREPRGEVWKKFLDIKRRFLGGRKLRVATGIEKMFALPVPQGIVSGSTREELRIMMENIAMKADVVGFILSDEDCTRGKPDPEGYLMALDRLGVAPRDAMVFEDSPAGIEAARRAGIPVAFVAELASRDSSADADVAFPTFLHAWEALRGRVAAA
jgi:beta-phosphoglucomutase-like phosphatase (HAD superfamily)